MGIKRHCGTIDKKTDIDIWPPSINIYYFYYYTLLSLDFLNNKILAVLVNFIRILSKRGKITCSFSQIKLVCTNMVT